MSALQQQSPNHGDLVLGLGTTGLSVARFLRRQGYSARFADTRETPPGIDALEEALPGAAVETGLRALPSDVTRVIASPGVEESNQVITEAYERGVDVVSDIQLFVDHAEAPFVGITGTNGKSTVTTLVGLMAEAAGLNAPTGGNLGQPALDLLEEAGAECFVLELSSFQLQRTRRLPAHVAALLNISPDHLDWHGSEENYRAAKYRIFDEAKMAVFNRADPVAEARATAVGRCLSFGDDEPADGQYGLRVSRGKVFLAKGERLLIDTDELAMVGSHNWLNALAALAIGELLELDETAMLSVLRRFGGLSHRMQRVRRVAGVDYINDSKATNVAAAVAAIRSLPGQLVLIAGGDGKGGEFAPLADALRGHLRAAVLIGRDAPAIGKVIEAVGPVHHEPSMTEAVRLASTLADEGDSVLLAPACASFDQYPNYMARGDDFARAVEELDS